MDLNIEGRYIQNNNSLTLGKVSKFLFFGRLSTTSKRYLLTTTLRQDGSSRFSKSNRWGTLPSQRCIINEPFSGKSTRYYVNNCV